MNVEIVIKDFDHTESIDERINQKISKISKFLDESATITWKSHGDKNHMVSEVNISNKGDNFHTKVVDRNLYHTFDMAIDKLKEQMRHKKYL
ncbi:MAG: HPF/RaiA family ribosome-associated protein [Bacteriovoracaceae bacterium]